MYIYSYQDTMDIIYFGLIQTFLELHHIELRSNLIIGICIGIVIGAIIMTITYESYIHFLAPEDLYRKLPKKFKEKYVEKSVESGRPRQLERDEKVSKEVIIREKVKVTYTLPEACPKCKAELKYGDVTMRGPASPNSTIYMGENKSRGVRRMVSYLLSRDKYHLAKPFSLLNGSSFPEIVKNVSSLKIVK